jgi:bifunctional ADP-heptose synthase (sugar kinase/adenylyltransferase)
VFCDPINVASESPMMALKRLGEESYWGGAAIVARHVAALGGRPLLLSAAGDGERSEQAAASLTAEGVDHRFIMRRGEIIAKTRFLVETSKLLKVEDGDANPLDTLAQREAASILHEAAADADAIVFCDFGYGTLSGTWVERSISALREKVGVMVADVSGDRANLLRFHKMDLLSPTERELRTSVNDFGRGLATVAWQVMNTAACRHLIVTLGQRGAVVFDRQSQDPADPKYRERLRSEHVPALGQIETDRLGCGDALTATAALSLSAGATLMQAAYLGSAAAALELRRIGNIPIHRRGLMQFLASRRELQAGLPPVQPIERVPAGQTVSA